MVYCGKASQSCQSCRTRRIKVRSSMSMHVHYYVHTGSIAVAFSCIALPSHQIYVVGNKSEALCQIRTLSCLDCRACASLHTCFHIYISIYNQYTTSPFLSSR
ncbi:hypothetical protein B0H67DRAFT_585418 [Lasiosphaeris hirsuta]|uniref:Uncharacterized protein n=1 Tax=Lasiosphaeris hirsuta TaxID=260670 RepID=A0AA40A8U9_9PEZI|nr:hypothetical protein B0H67DRAFT_585418 [Lasiosphaeris hirsuta]